MRSNGAFEGGFHLSGGKIHALAPLEDGPLAVLRDGPATSWGASSSATSWSFPPIDLDNEDEDFGREIAEVEAAVDAIAIAAARTGAVRDRWVNRGMAQDEYRDFVRAGRPERWPSEGA